MTTIVGIRFHKLGKIYHFDATAHTERVHEGDYVLVSTARGRQIGQVVQFVNEAQQPEGGWRSIERPASAQDMLLQQSWKSREPEALVVCRERAVQLALRGVKIVAAEYGYDGSHLTYLFSVEGEDKPELKSLRGDMQQRFGKTQVELRQIGPRDVARLIGGLGACGLTSRCCSKFLTEFSPISIKMAKAQGISLNPSEITGMCGRLRCCLVYEYEQYAAARKELPKRNKRVVTPLGEGRVVDILPLQMTVIVEVPEVGRREFERDQLEPWDELEALRRKSAEPCANCPKGETNPGTT